MKKLYTIVILLTLGITQTQIYAQAQCFNCEDETKAFTIGSNTMATGKNSFAGGTNSVVTNSDAFVFGYLSTVSGLRGIALGNLTDVSQTDGIAIGNKATSNESNCYVFGQNLSGNANNSITIGLGSSKNQLTNNKPYSLMFGVTQNPSLTIVKPASGANMGYLGIGTDAPEEMVHLRGKLLIESTETTQGGLQFRHPATRGLPPDDPQIYTPLHFWDIYSDTQGLMFNTIEKNNGVTTQRIIISNSGLMGIGVAKPTAKLDVGGSFKAQSANITNDINAQNATLTGTLITNALSTQTLNINEKLGVGVNNPLTNIQIGNIWTFQDRLSNLNMGRNTWHNGNNEVRIQTGYASRMNFNSSGDILLQTAPTGAANTTISWNTVTFANNGDVGIGTTAAPSAKLEVNGSFKAQSATISDNLTVTTATITNLVINKLNVPSINVDTVTTKILKVTGNSYLSGNVGIGTTPANLKTKFQIGDTWTFYDGATNKNIGRNTWYDGTNDVRIQQGAASRINFNSSGDINFQTAETGTANSTISRWNAVTILNDGRVGIGATDPQAKLNVDGAFKAQSAIINGITYINGNLGVGIINPTTKLHVVGNSYFNGNVGIGVSNPIVKLDVGGIIRAHEVKVCIDQGCDYVFDENYELMSLSDLNSFIRTNKHLPDVAPAAEMEAEGINLSEMNALLLRKVEELTLYILGQESQMIELEKRLSDLENKKGGE